MSKKNLHKRRIMSGKRKEPFFGLQSLKISSRKKPHNFPIAKIPTKNFYFILNQHIASGGAKRSNHAAGKIVKPIAVRPVSSASSSHSSSLASTTHSSQSSSLLSLIRQGSSELKSSAADAGFSIIAKYFASFPATRLKSAPSCAEPGPFDHFKTTPFLPFKKTNAATSSTCSVRSHEPACNTDHLCTNFRRLIKLSHDDEPPASPLTARACLTPLTLTDPDSNDSDQLDSRLGQMTMETRSTRKFLIKHHPYLRHNSQLVNSVSPSHARPSINLLKMKKFERNDSPLLLDSSQVDSAPPNTRRRSKLRKNCRKDEETTDADDAYELSAGQQSLNSSKELDDCKEEDSSGYYSSYQSVDLVSTSGGSCVGESLAKRSSDRSCEKVKQEQPHHHYQTRYFTNYLQSLPSEQKPCAARPVTRLRYQQQQQQVASNGTNGQSCDLDLDLIEND
ncbi:hypothetical protein BpHYR1_015782 [Brachionus plicatilis]|uniref:Uncharacterized protein n=1 Tax=Brachionus plicatilis TaxID=10195 RepID=A0A3M7T3T2_BRAPC|nr:hypothetical protein BpHYR1_015782 [Brachionus plicatilis]